MGKKHRLILPILLTVGVVGAVAGYILTHDVAILNPKGTVATEQKQLLITATLLMLIVVIPVFIMVAVFAWKYRESNKKAKYTPEWDGHTALELTWWAIPFIIIAVISVLTWRTSHSLDPFKPLESQRKPITIQVVALDWKWLFLYPEENVASVNYLQVPEDTPVNFEITADAPMNSFWIPQLGGQVYAMSGMKTQLHLIANEPGDYQGSSANLSGKGFAGMKFTTRASSDAEYEDWLNSVRRTNSSLSQEEYTKLAQPSENVPPKLYSSYDKALYDKIIMKYMMPDQESSPAEHKHSTPETGVTPH